MSSFFVNHVDNILYQGQSERTTYILSSPPIDEYGIINMYLPREIYNQMMLNVKQEIAAITGKYNGKNQTIVRNCITNTGFLEVGDIGLARDILQNKFVNQNILNIVTITVHRYISQFENFFLEGTAPRTFYNRIKGANCLLLCSTAGNSISKFISGDKLSKSEFLFGSSINDLAYSSGNVSVLDGSFVLKIYTVDNESVRAMMPPPLGVNIEQLIKYKAKLELVVKQDPLALGETIPITNNDF